MSEAPVFRLENVTLPGIGGAQRLDGVSVEIPPGVTAIVGASGAGKSSLLEVLAGFARPSQSLGIAIPGLWDGRERTRLPLFWLPSDLGLWPGETVRGHVTAVAPRGGSRGPDDWLTDFGLAPLARRYPGILSAGERSRLAAARAAASGAAVLLLDEPFAHVDPHRLPACWAALRRCWEGGPTHSAVFATHDPAAAVRESTHLLVMDAGRVTLSGPTAELYDDPANRVGDLLGPVNRVPAAWTRRLGWNVPKIPGGGANVRPERVAVSPAGPPAGGEAPVSVDSTRPAGPTTETVLTAADLPPLTLTHRTGPPLTVGGRATVRLCSLLIACFLLTGCEADTADGPRLDFAAVNARALPNDGPTLPAPRGAACGPGGECYVLDDAGRVLVYSPDGKYLRRWDMPANETGNPEGVCQCFDPHGAPLIAVADTHYHRVVIFTPEGTEVTRFGSEGDGEGQFRYPVAICGDDAGRLYVGEYGGNDRVQIFAPIARRSRNDPPAFAFVRAFGSYGSGEGQFQRASGVAWVKGGDGGPGTVFVVDAFGDRVQVWGDDGEYRGLLGGGRAPLLRSPYDVTLDAAGTLWVPEYHGARVTRLAADGTLLGRWGELGSAAGQLATPWGLAVGPTGTVWICDTGNRRLVRLSP